jgi:hypothetical protein
MKLTGWLTLATIDFAHLRHAFNQTVEEFFSIIAILCLAHAAPFSLPVSEGTKALARSSPIPLFNNITKNALPRNPSS